MIDNCDHEIGRKVIGGFSGHEHIHLTGEQLCLKCGKTLSELLKRQKPDLTCELIVDFTWKLRLEKWLSAQPIGKNAERIRIEFTEIKEPQEKVDKIKTIINAWQIKGPRPDWHLKQQLTLKFNWPTLYAAIVDLIKESIE